MDAPPPPRPAFRRYVGIDFSGAAAPETPLPGLRAFVASRDDPPTEARPAGTPRRHWSRANLADWLMTLLAEGVPTLVGMDHGFSFPLAYFEKYGLAADWPAFLDDFAAHWPTDAPGARVEDVRRGLAGRGGARCGDARWRRLCEARTGRAKSVFHFDVPGSVAKSTFAGLPWLRRLRRGLGRRVHFWPYDGWDAPPGASVLAEAYPSLWREAFPRRPGHTPDQHDACCAAAWLRRADLSGALPQYLTPRLSPEELAVAAVEGWILGVAPV
jgi:hypothetical protein